MMNECIVFILVALLSFGSAKTIINVGDGVSLESAFAMVMNHTEEVVVRIPGGKYQFAAALHTSVANVVEIEGDAKDVPILEYIGSPNAVPMHFKGKTKMQNVALDLPTSDRAFVVESLGAFKDVNIRTNAVVGVDTSSSNVKFQGTVMGASVNSFRAHTSSLDDLQLRTDAPVSVNTTKANNVIISVHLMRSFKAPGVSLDMMSEMSGEFHIEMASDEEGVAALRVQNEGNLDVIDSTLTNGFLFATKSSIARISGSLHIRNTGAYYSPLSIENTAVLKMAHGSSAVLTNPSDGAACAYVTNMASCTVSHVTFNCPIGAEVKSMAHFESKHADKEPAEKCKTDGFTSVCRFN